MPDLKALFRLSLPALLLSAMPAFACPIDMAVDIEWNGSQFDGVILDGPNPQGNCLVSYDGWDASWNEWVVQERIAPVTAAVATATDCFVGVPLEIEWNDRWWDGVVLEGPNAQGRCLVTYDGWEASWNEWVTVDRLRATQ